MVIVDNKELTFDNWRLFFGLNEQNEDNTKNTGFKILTPLKSTQSAAVTSLEVKQTDQPVSSNQIQAASEVITPPFSLKTGFVLGALSGSLITALIAYPIYAFVRNQNLQYEIMQQQLTMLKNGQLSATSPIVSSMPAPANTLNALPAAQQPTIQETEQALPAAAQTETMPVIAESEIEEVPTLATESTAQPVSAPVSNTEAVAPKTVVRKTSVQNASAKPATQSGSNKAANSKTNKAQAQRRSAPPVAQNTYAVPQQSAYAQPPQYVAQSAVPQQAQPVQDGMVIIVNKGIQNRQRQQAEAKRRQSALNLNAPTIQEMEAALKEEGDVVQSKKCFPGMTKSECA